MQDEKIVKLYWDRNEQAITETSEKYGHYCTKIAYNILSSNEDAQECVNDTYMNAWNSLPPHKPSILSTFLGKIVRNLSFNRYKHKRALKRGGSETALVLDELCDIVSDKEDVESAVSRKELVKALNEFIGEMSKEKRYMFIRRYWYTDSVKDIAEKCGRSENSVSVELNRTRKKLCDYLKERGFDL